MGFPSSEAFLEMKGRNDNIVSRKIKNATPLEMSAYAMASSGKYAQYYKNMVKGNILFVGDASGGAGNIHGMIQGQFAGSVAASAIKDHDVSEERLSEYQDLVFDKLGRAPFHFFSAIDDFGSFNQWFREVEEATRGIEAKELDHFR
jgi:flavin-dependent dehydrogenase